MYVFQKILTFVIWFVITFGCYFGSYYAATLLLGAEFNLSVGIATALILIVVAVIAREVTKLIQEDY